jgi:hypothetical protein
VKAKLVIKPGAGHGWADIQPDIEKMTEWFDETLASKK